MLHLAPGLSSCCFKQMLHPVVLLLWALIFCSYAAWICRIDPFHMIPDVPPTQFEKPGSPICLHCTCRSTKGPEVSPSAFISRLPRSWAFYHLKTPALFSPHMLDLNGCVTLGCKIQVLLSQMFSQLPDLKLETEQRKELIICNSVLRFFSSTQSYPFGFITFIFLWFQPHFL